jgi:dienelactone hydrolase
MTHPWESCDKEKIIESAKRMIRYDEALVPTVRDFTEYSRTEYDGYTAIEYRYESWEKTFGSATLYLPYSKEKLPLVFVCCGHGEEGRLTPSYMAMGHRLASCGLAALVIDNIGQGDRNCHEPSAFKNPDHWWSVAPFYCGLTLQGMIVMETVAMIRFMAQDPRFDPARLGACGNSGGGTATPLTLTFAPHTLHSPRSIVLGTVRRLYAPSREAQSFHAPTVFVSGLLIQVSSTTVSFEPSFTNAASFDAWAPSHTVPCATSLAITRPLFSSEIRQRIRV